MCDVFEGRKNKKKSSRLNSFVSLIQKIYLEIVLGFVAPEPLERDDADDDDTLDIDSIRTKKKIFKYL